jgi:hypothetical protein
MRASILNFIIDEAETIDVAGVHWAIIPLLGHNAG